VVVKEGEPKPKEELQQLRSGQPFVVGGEGEADQYEAQRAGEKDTHHQPLPK